MENMHTICPLDYYHHYIRHNCYLKNTLLHCSVVVFSDGSTRDFQKVLGTNFNRPLNSRANLSKCSEALK